MKKTTCIVLIFGLLSFGCGDDAHDLPTAEAGLPSAGSGGSSSPRDAGAFPAGMGAFGGGGGSFGFDAGPCFSMPCMCFDCGGGCFDCGMGCACSGGSPPQPLPWEPPFDDVGSQGWMESDEPFCAGVDDVYSFEVWSDVRGVFAMISGYGYEPIAPDVDEDGGVPADHSATQTLFDGGMGSGGEYTARTEIWFNDGNGWGVGLDRIGMINQFGFTGLPSSSLLLNEPNPPLDMGFGISRCALGTLDENSFECLDIDAVQSVYVVDAARAYAAMGGTRLLEWDGERWRSNTALIPYPVTALWSDGSSVIGVGKAGTVLWLDAGTWTLEDPGTLASLTSVWGRARDDVWAGTSAGTVLHYDGSSWTQVAQLGGVTCDFAPAVTGIWGAGGQVYFHSDTQLARWNGSELETLANWSCSASANSGQLRITGLWGNAEDDVFISLIDAARFPVGQCGPAFVVHYDGEAFHRM